MSEAHIRVVHRFLILLSFARVESVVATRSYRMLTVSHHDTSSSHKKAKLHVQMRAFSPQLTFKYGSGALNHQ